MSRPCRPVLLSVAVAAALFAFEASAEDKPAAPAEHQASDTPIENHAVDDGHAAPAEAAAAAAEPGASAAEAAPSTAEAGGTEAGETDAAAGEAANTDFAMAGDMDSLEPYKLVRSLQFVQDQVVMGDHSAMEMQRFLLNIIDKRLREADQRAFDDPRNVDAALIYAMSGGNPETLDFLAIRDKFGNFDNEVTTVLRAYLNGRAAMNKDSLTDVVKLYRDTQIGPYITLVAANVAAALNDDKSLRLFDWARLTAPGTLVEEAALRRSLFISARKNLVDEALKYAQLYARRFINSPYAGQYADLLVDLVVLNYGKVGDERLNAILSFMDRPRKREVYLRIARKAVIMGLRDLAVFAAGKAEALLGPDDKTPKTLVDLYSQMARIPTSGVDAVLDELNAVSERRLSYRDRALREAARVVAAEVIRKPDPNSLTQGLSPIVAPTETSAGDGMTPPETASETEPGAPETPVPATADSAAPPTEEEMFRGFVTERKQALERIDKLLEGVEEDKGS